MRTRIFHPVGQGAFYSETHILNESDFTVVYDCGSKSINQINFSRKIKSTFPKNHKIDILFISHFHADHINGIKTLAEHCQIKKVVIPLLDDDAKILLYISNLILYKYADRDLIDNPERFFGDDTTIIRIQPTEINTITENGTLIDISTIQENVDIASGVKLVLYKDADWLFIPFNYKHTIRKIQFELALKNNGLKFSDIDTIEKINKHKKIITKAYKHVDGDLNKNSMILFSGKEQNDYIKVYTNCTHSCIRELFYSNIESGCLYMGDIDLNEPGIVDDIFIKLKSLFLYAGTLQVPHHGSVHNFSKSILKDNIRCAIFSYGITNNYGHPSDRIIGEIAGHDITPYLVTEDQKSIVVQWKK